MGNPLSPVLADMVLEGLLDTVTAQMDFKPPVLRKYVDDFILAIPLNKLKYVHDMFNSYDKHIQFTYELEENRRLPYLDMVLVRKENQTVRTEWFSKPIASGRFLLSLVPTKNERCQELHNESGKTVHQSQQIKDGPNSRQLSQN